jgi:hypothetical protein
LLEIHYVNFILEKRNNRRLFLVLITIEGSGTTNTFYSYPSSIHSSIHSFIHSFIHSSIHSSIHESDHKSTVYYRLIKIDFDGKSTTSPIIAVGKYDKNTQQLRADAYFNIS